MSKPRRRGGIVSGYACGGTNPQTGPPNRATGPAGPTTGPATNVTRGQLTKIVVAPPAAGWTLLNPATATFSDVPAGSTFYPYVETAVCHGVVGGYTDGTFRPSNPPRAARSAKSSIWR